MKYRRFGRTEMMVSQFTLGCMQITGESPEENAILTIERAVPYTVLVAILDELGAFCPSGLRRSKAVQLWLPGFETQDR